MLSEYDSHLPLLRLVGQVVDPRSVLECGAGLYSTPRFLDRKYFENLEVLTSVEVDPIWSARVQGINVDSRLTLMDGLPSWNINSYDLIFIDDGTSAGMRLHTIDTILQRTFSPLIIIHDFVSVDAYRKAVAVRPEVVWRAIPSADCGLVWRSNSAVGSNSAARIIREQDSADKRN